MAYYADIVEIQAPSEAIAGELVNIVARIKNLATYPIYICASAKYDNNIFYLYPEWVIVEAGATYSFSGSFNMPNKNVKVYVWSYYWSAPNWYLDDEEAKDVKLKELVPSITDFKIVDYVKV